MDKNLIDLVAKILNGVTYIVFGGLLMAVFFSISCSSVTLKSIFFNLFRYLQTSTTGERLISLWACSARARR